MRMDLAITQSLSKEKKDAPGGLYGPDKSQNHLSMHQRTKQQQIQQANLNLKGQQLINSSKPPLNSSDSNVSSPYQQQYFAISDDDYYKRQLAVQSLIRQANNKLNLYINNENIKKPHPVTVEVYLIFLRVGEIDNVKERFQTDAYFEACWEDETVDAKQPFDPRQHWEPELFLENAVANLKQDIKYRVEPPRMPGGKTRVFESRNIKGVFWERLELWDFPLDVQNLSITITSARNKDEVRFVQSPHFESTINTNDFQQQQEWNLYPFIEQSEKVVHDVWNNNDRPCITFSSTISRRPGYFLYNAYMLIFLISVLGFVPFSFSYTFPHFRIQTTCLLILSSINFRWIVTQKLPTVSYLTTLDKYAIGALVFLVSLCAWHAIIGSNIIPNNLAVKPSQIDNIALCSIASLYVMFHIIYSLFFLFKYLRYGNIGKDKMGGVKSSESAVKLEQNVAELDSKPHESTTNLAVNNSTSNVSTHGEANKSSSSSLSPPKPAVPGVTNSTAASLNNSAQNLANESKDQPTSLNRSKNLSVKMTKQQSTRGNGNKLSATELNSSKSNVAMTMNKSRESHLDGDLAGDHHQVSV